jgi:hypothetical protein
MILKYLKKTFYLFATVMLALVVIDRSRAATPVADNPPVASALPPSKKPAALTPEDISREYHLKAAFLRYIAQFVSWPKGAEPDTEINICLYGHVPSIAALNSINGKIVNDRPLLIRPILNLQRDAKLCQILYVLGNTKESMKAIITTTQNEPILTIGDMDGFAEAGGSMNFYIVNNRMALTINQEAVAKAHLLLQPRLLKLVTIVPNVTAG